jgi:xanthine dehydrogenase/oxidase
MQCLISLKMTFMMPRTLECQLQAVHIAETSTDKVPNASPTAASASSDLYGAAILDACSQLTSRLAPIRKSLGPAASMKEVAGEAWMQRVDMCAHGFYATPDITGSQGDMPFNYFVFGAAVVEVEVDCLTGDWRNSRSDIVMDVGNPINPSIDIGQIEGGFVQVLLYPCTAAATALHVSVCPSSFHVPTLGNVASIT